LRNDPSNVESRDSCRDPLSVPHAEGDAVWRRGQARVRYGHRRSPQRLGSVGVVAVTDGDGGGGDGGDGGDDDGDGGDGDGGDGGSGSDV